MKPTCTFYDFDPEQKREYEELCTTLPFPMDSNEPPSSTLFDFGDHILPLCMNFCRYLKITGEKYPITYAYFCCAPDNEHVIR